MRAILENKTNKNIRDLMRGAGYKLLGQKDEELNFVRPVDRFHYPRFHIHLSQQQDKYQINLHLDQKKPSYKGAKAHSAEYQGQAIEKELARIQQFFVTK